MRPFPKNNNATVAVRKRSVPRKQSKKVASPWDVASSSRVSSISCFRTSRLLSFPNRRVRDLRASSGRPLEMSQTGDLLTVSGQASMSEVERAYSGIKKARSGSPPTSH